MLPRLLAKVSAALRKSHLHFALTLVVHPLYWLVLLITRSQTLPHKTPYRLHSSSEPNRSALPSSVFASQAVLMRQELLSTIEQL